MITCPYCNREFERYYSNFTRHIKEIHNITAKMFYDNFFLCDYYNKCIICGVEAVFISIELGYNKTCGCKKCKQELRKLTCLEKYGVEYSSQSDIIKKRKIENSIIKHGVESPNSLDVVKNKKSVSSMKKYGVDNISKSEIIKQQKKETCMKNYGVDVPAKSEVIKEKMQNTCLDKYGFNNPLQSDVIKEKIKLTNIERYGVEFTSQSDIIKNKVNNTWMNKTPEELSVIYYKQQKYRWKDYMLPSGIIIKIQGYENFALDDIFLAGYTEDEIITNRINMPIFYYTGEDNRRHMYYPDIYIPKENLIIEVKSLWTMKKYYKINKLKELSCITAGFNFEFLIYDNKGVIVK